MFISEHNVESACSATHPQHSHQHTTCLDLIATTATGIFVAAMSVQPQQAHRLLRVVCYISIILISHSPAPMLVCHVQGTSNKQEEHWLSVGDA
jgi:hypothetical protein